MQVLRRVRPDAPGARRARPVRAGVGVARAGRGSCGVRRGPGRRRRGLGHIRLGESLLAPYTYILCNLSSLSSA